MLPVTPASGPPPQRRFGHPLILVFVAAVALLAGAGGAALATSGTSSPATADSASSQASPTPSASAPGKPPSARGPIAQAPGGGGGGFYGGGIGGGFSGAPVHGTLVVPASGGGYQTEDIQRGKVTAISSSSITLLSADKYTKAYQVTGSTSVNAGHGGLSTVKVGDQVSITATVHGSTATVNSIIDLSRLGNGSFGPGGGNQGQPSS
jgi:hypothetical protein